MHIALTYIRLKTSFHSEYWNRVVDLLQFNRDDNPTAVYLEAPTPPADMILQWRGDVLGGEEYWEGR